MEISKSKQSLTAAGTKTPPAPNLKMEISKSKQKPGGSRRKNAACHQPEDGDIKVKKTGGKPGNDQGFSSRRLPT
jgi:hypothetical protein